MKDNDELIGLLVHSYNNYLAGMMGYCELALLENTGEQNKDFLERSLASGKEAVDFGQSLLASISRLQLPMKQCSLVGLLNSTLEYEHNQPIIFIEQLNWKLEPLKSIEITTDSGWLSDCIVDLIAFTQFIVKNKAIELNINVNEPHRLVEITIGGVDAKLSDRQQMSLFEPYYSSRKLMGTKDIGLAKAKGFISQMKALLDWENGKGFVLEIPYSTRRQ